MHGHVRAATHGDADVGRGQGRGVVDAVADHGDHGAIGLEFSHGGGLVRRQHLGMHRLDAQRLCHYPRAAAVVAGDQVAADGALAQGCHGVSRTVLQGIAESEQAQHAAFRFQFQQPGEGAPFGFPGLGGIGQVAGREMLLVQQATVAEGKQAAVHPPLDAASGQGLAGVYRGGFEVAFGAGVQHRPGQRVLAAALQGAGQLQQLAFVAIARHQVGDARAAGGEGAGLVEGHRLHRVGDFQGFGVLDQDAVTRGDAGAGHDRGGRGQAQGAGAGDHQHGHGVDQRGLDAGAGQQPAHQGGEGDEQDRRDEHLADLVHQFLDRRLGGLGVFHQADDPRQHGFAAQGRGAHQQPAFAVDRAGGDAVAGLLRHRQAFTADQGFIGVALALADFAVGREALAGLDHQQVAKLQGGDGDFFLAAFTQAGGTFRSQGLQGADGGTGLALGAAFQVFAQQHQGDHHRRGFEIQVRHLAGWRRPPLVEAQAVAGAGADGHQQVHVAGAGLHRLPGGAIEARTEDELHRRRQDELDPGRQHPVAAEPFQQHGHHQRQGQGEGEQYRPALTAQAGLGIVDGRPGFVHPAGAVAGAFHGADQGGAVHLAEQLQMGAFAGQVHAHLRHARHLAQRAFHAAGATGAGHAADGQFQALGGNLVARRLDGRHQGRQAVARGLDAGLFSGQVDAGGLHARHLGQGAFDPSSTAGTGHSADGQIDGNRLGHGLILLICGLGSTLTHG
ncbi:hypothetical protein D9M71_111790 [compost metagenome]